MGYTITVRGERWTDVDAKSLCDAILNATISLGLKCTFIAQCYDGASVMSGHVTGVQTRFSEVHWSAVYVHCHVFLSQCDFNVLLFTLKNNNLL